MGQNRNIANIDIAALENSIQTHYPTIIARSYERFLLEPDPSKALMLLVQGVYQNILRHLALLSLSEYCEQSCSKPSLNEIILQLQRPQYGHWEKFLRATCDHFKDDRPRMIEELVDIFDNRKHPGLKVGLLLSNLTNLKNKRISHGVGLPSSEESARLVETYRPQLAAWLDELEWLCKYPLFARSPEGLLLRLEGCNPSAQPSSDFGRNLEAFFWNGQAVLPAFPFYLNLWEAGDGSSSNLFLFNGASQKRVQYLSHATCHEEKSDRIVGALREKLTQKALQLRELCSELTCENILEESQAHTRKILDDLTQKGRFNPKVYVAREAVESAFHYWLESRDHEVEGAKPGLILSGEAGSGKSMSLYFAAQRMLDRPHPTLLLQARELGGPAIQDLETEIRHACRRPEALETVLAALQGEGLILYVLIDAIEEGCSPGELLQSAFLLLARYADRGLRIAMTVRDVAFDYLTRSPHVARVLESIRKHLSHFETEECGKRISRPYFLLPRVNEEELNTFLELYFSEYNICSGKISKNSKQILMNPLLLRMVCESYSGQHIPQNITAHKIFNEYIKVKLVNPITNKFDKESIRLLQRLVQLLFDKKITQIDEDLLYDDNYFGKFIRDNDLNSPFNRLLDQAILVRIVEDNDSPFSPISVRVNFDRLLEVLALDIFEKKGLHALLAEIGKKPVFGPLVGVLTLWLLKAGESLDTLPFSLVAENLFDDDVSRATLRALEEISFTDFPFVVRVVEILGDTASPAALECALKLTRLCSHSGRWQMSTEILRVIRKTKGSKSRDCKFIIQKIELVNANDLFKMGKNREALAVFHELIDSPDASIQAEALQGEILVYDSYDQTAYFEASEKCLALADEIGNPDLRAFALWSLGGYYEYKNQYEEALAFYQRILEMESLGEKGQVLGMRPYIDDLAPVYTWIGRALQGIPRRAAEAETFFRKALEMDQKAGRLYRISVGWNNLASFFFQVAGDTSSALQYSDKELSQELLFPNDPEWACSYYIRSCIMMMLGNWDEAGASAAKSVHISDGFRLAGEGHQNYLGYGYFSCFCVALGKGDTVGAKSMLDDLSSLDRDAETDPELDLMVKTADFALSCIEGRLPGRKCLDDLLEQYRAHNLVIPGCNHVGLVLLAIDRTKRSLGHPGFFETLYGVAMEIGNRFWMEFTSGRRFNLPDKACVTATTAQSGEKEVIMRSSMKSQGFIKPPGLRPGDRIAVIAPSSPVDTVQIRAGLEIMREKALEPVLGRNLRFVRSRGLYAAPLKDRIQECIEAFADPSISAIIVGTGGFGSSQLLPHLPYDRIRREPKILMGFSDVTALNAGLLTKAGLISFNGPSASIRQDTEGNARADGLALRDALDLLMCGKPWKERPFLRNKMLPRCVFPGCAEGPAIGGNLTTLACLMGTPFFPDPSGAILFLEDIHEGGYEMARTLNHLRLGGILDQISGVVLGEFAKAPDHVDPGDPSIEEVIFEFFSEGPPCVYGYNFSHGDTGAVLPVGGMVRLDAEACQVEFDSPILL